jgi:hypothetical protein
VNSKMHRNCFKSFLVPWIMNVNWLKRNKVSGIY